VRRIAVPLRENFADEVYIVTSGEYMALYAANNICKGIKKLKGSFGGIICNCRGIENELEIVQEFAGRVNSRIIGVIPRNEIVQKSEIDAKNSFRKISRFRTVRSLQRTCQAIYVNQKFVILNQWI